MAWLAALGLWADGSPQYAARMRVARGKVKGSTIVVEGDPLPDGTEVTVWADAVEFELDEASRDLLSAADASIDRGEGLSMEQLLERLRRIRAA
ncbi:MAG: hypothetical protein JNJ54_04235 [Myxococcaceae bacterium]|nr:hypothetical protein [Myxococcaceae bacterium]